MKKLSEYKNEEALDLLAGIIEPVALVFADKGFVEALQENILKSVSYLLKNHKKEVISILSSLDGVPVEEYECNLFTIPLKLVEILNDEDLKDFFRSQGLKVGAKSSGSATENIVEEQLEDS